jgi:hypothetical protein
MWNYLFLYSCEALSSISGVTVIVTSLIWVSSVSNQPLKFYRHIIRRSNCTGVMLGENMVKDVVYFIHSSSHIVPINLVTNMESWLIWNSISAQALITCVDPVKDLHSCDTGSCGSKAYTNCSLFVSGLSVWWFHIMLWMELWRHWWNDSWMSTVTYGTDAILFFVLCTLLITRNILYQHCMRGLGESFP